MPWKYPNYLTANISPLQFLVASPVVAKRRHTRTHAYLATICRATGWAGGGTEEWMEEGRIQGRIAKLFGGKGVNLFFLNYF